VEELLRPGRDVRVTVADDLSNSGRRIFRGRARRHPHRQADFVSFAGGAQALPRSRCRLEPPPASGGGL